MLANQNKHFFILKEDYEALVRYLRTHQPELRYDQVQAQKLTHKLQWAQVVPPKSFPADVVRLTSKVRLRNAATRLYHECSVVLPGPAYYRESSISVLSPMGKQMLGARKGDTIIVEAAAGKREYQICDVSYRPGGAV